MELINLSIAVTALVASCGAAFWAGRVDGRLNNGVSVHIKNTREDVRKIFDRMDNLPCKAYVERLRHIEQTVERIQDHG